MFYFFVFLVLAIMLVTVVFLSAPNLDEFDAVNREQFSTGDSLNEEHEAIIQSIKEMNKGPIREAKGKERLRLTREYMDSLAIGKQFVSSITSVDAGGVSAEWVVAPGVDTSRRLLYIHGGAFYAGSPLSHRSITDQFSLQANAAVLAIDYRLMPEHGRLAGLEDSQVAYKWMLANGPDGSTPAASVMLAGDSAGGNLVLVMLNWIRDQKLQAPKAAVALAPLTDSTFSAPSYREKQHSDVMLGPMFKALNKLPKWLLRWVYVLQNRIKPSNPIVSPLFADLSGLPPILLHASEAEMLLGDSQRYVNKAVAAGSPVTMQSWAHVVHVWHIYHPELTEARQAFEEIGKFIAEHNPR